MKKILVLALMLSLLVPVTVMAAGAGGSANNYELRVDKLVFRQNATTSDTITLSTGTTGFGIVGAAPDTSIAYTAENIVCPMGASAWMGFLATCATNTANGDSIGIQIQYSQDGSTWFGSNTALAIQGQVPSVGLTPVGTKAPGIAEGVVVEAATMPTSPLWKHVRFLVQHWDGNSVGTGIPSVAIWWSRYVKVNR